MRPLRLVMRAFGPYADEQVLDFTELGERRFLLVHGPTGAGKSSILDALCFALFGETSGQERVAAEMRSHHADVERPTEVELEFCVGEERWHVLRRPEQELPKKRGEGTRRFPPEATLSRLDGDGAATVVADKWARVTEECERRLGFSAAQFRQVVVLPQGRFRELLVADSGERERILEALFGTEVFKRLTEALRERAGELRRDLEAHTARRDTLLEQCGVADVAALDAAVVALEARLGRLEAELTTRRRQAEADAKALRGGEEAAERLAEKTQSENALAALLERSDAVEALRTELAAAERAAALETLLETAEARAGEHGAAGRAVRAAALERADAARRLEAAEQAFAAARATQATVTGLRERRGRLSPLADAGLELAGLRDRLAAREVRIADARGAVAQGERYTSQLQVDLRKDLTELQQLRERLGGLEGARQAARAAQDQLRRRRELDSRRSVLLQATVEARGLAAIVDEEEAALGRLRMELGGLERLRADAAAALLASGLCDGDPCPVCGATEHPHLAEAPSRLPEEADLERHRELIEELEQKLAGSRQRAAKARSVHDSEREKVALLGEGLGELAEAEPAEAERRARDAEEALANLGRANNTAAELSRTVDRREADLAEEREALVEVRERLQQLGAEQARDQGNLERLEASLPEDLRADGAVGAALAAIAAELERLEHARETAAAEREAASAAMSAADAAHAISAEAEQTAAVAAARVAERVAAALGEAGFADARACRSAMRAGAERDRLDAEISRYEEALAAARDRVLRATEAARELVLPDLEALRAAWRRAAEEVEHTLGEQAGAREQQAALARVRADVAEVGAQLAEAERRYATLGRLAEVASGRNALKLPFARFVLAQLLEDVLERASERLALMSNQRYRLARSREVGDRRSTGGLELEVMDAYTGVARSVRTLSGGESFLASLSLALGLADAVQSHAGGVRLETIFIDEGFGSLDSEALDLAMRALIDLQSGGRLVGIISHVAELVDRIATRLVVTTTRSGSQARFHLG